MLAAFLCAAWAAARPATSNPTREIAPGVFMPILSLGHPDFTGHYVNGTTAATELWLSDKVNGSGIDTAYVYHNQAAVGAALRESGRSRRSYFVTTKIPGSIGREAALANVRDDLAQLGLKQADLVLIHTPCACVPCGAGCPKVSDDVLRQTWLGLQDAVSAGLARAIGVSNFGVAQLEAVLALSSTAGFVPPAVNQCQMSVASHDDETRRFSQRHGITYEAYSPFGRDGVFSPLNVSDPRIVAIADAHAKSPWQVCLRWVVQLDCVLTFSATKLSHDLSDRDIFDFELTPHEMEVLSAI